MSRRACAPLRPRKCRSGGTSPPIRRPGPRDTLREQDGSCGAGRIPGVGLGAGGRRRGPGGGARRGARPRDRPAPALPRHADGGRRTHPRPVGPRPGARGHAPRPPSGRAAATGRRRERRPPARPRGPTRRSRAAAAVVAVLRRLPRLPGRAHRRRRRAPRARRCARSTSRCAPNSCGCWGSAAPRRRWSSTPRGSSWRATWGCPDGPICWARSPRGVAPGERAPRACDVTLGRRPILR